MNPRRAAAWCTAALLLLAAPSANAAEDRDPWLGQLARALSDDPVVVSDSVTRAVSPRELAGLRAAVRAMPFPTRVAILSGPPRNFDTGGPDLFELPELLAGAVDRPGLYVVAEVDETDLYGSIHATAIGVRPRVAPSDIERALDQDVAEDARAVTRIRYGLRLAVTGERPLRGVAERALDKRIAAREARRDRVDTENAVAAGFLGGGALVGFAIPTVLWWRRRPRGHAQSAPRELREPGAEAAASAADAVARLAASITAARQPPDLAFELYSAASKADREASTPIDHVGALVLAEDGAAVLAGRPRPERCFFDPGHGGATTQTRWRQGVAEAEVPACKRCAEALRADRAPDALADRGRPYYERNTIWGRTGLGSIDEKLAEHVLAGR